MSEPSLAQGDPPQERQRLPRRRRAWRWVGVGAVAAACLLVLLIVLLPTLLSTGPGSRLALSAVSARWQGTARAERLSIGWFSPLELEQFELVSRDDELLARVPRLTGTQTLWDLLVDWRRWGAFHFDQPHVQLVFDGQGSNLRRTFARPAEGEPASQEPGERPRMVDRIPRVDASLSIDEGRLTVVRSDRSDWGMERLEIVASLQRAPQAGRAPHLLVEPGRPIDRVELTPEICDDLLKFIAPVLADVTRAEGRFSIELTEGARLPLDALDEGHLAGEFSVHSVDVGPGPLVRRLAELFGFPATVRLADESVVPFELVEGRVYHRNLRFGLPRLWVETHGSVGLDQSLDLVAEIPLAGLSAEGAPIREALGQQTLRLPIGGTLSEPRVDGQRLRESGLEALGGTLRELVGDESISLEELVERLRERGFLQDGRLLPRREGEGLLRRRAPQGEGELTEPAPPAEESERRLGDRLLRRREPEERPPAPSSDSVVPHESELSEPPFEPREGRPLRRLLRRAIEAIDEAEPQREPIPPPPAEAPL